MFSVELNFVYTGCESKNKCRVNLEAFDVVDQMLCTKKKQLYCLGFQMSQEQSRCEISMLTSYQGINPL